jgi:hypothetical protein
MEAKNKEEVNWVGMLFWSLKPGMEKWLLGDNMPPVLYVAQMVDMLLQKWFLIEGHQPIGWYVEVGCEEDKGGWFQLVVSNPPPLLLNPLLEGYYVC